MTDASLFDFQFGNPSSASRQTSGPFRIVVLGNFSGKKDLANPSTPEMLHVERAPRRIDIDNFDDVLGRVAPTLEVSGLGGENSNSEHEQLTFRELDAFHPDELLLNCPSLQALVALKSGVQKASSAAEARQLLSETLPDIEGDIGTATQAHPSSPTSETEQGTLERLLGKPTNPTTARATTGATSLHAMLQAVVTPHIVAGQDPAQEELVRVVDEVLTLTLRSILHDRSFQQLESLWRGIHYLVSNVEAEGLEFYLWDQEPSALHQATQPPSEQGGPQDTAAFQRLRDTANGEPWALLVSCFEVESAEDLAMHARLAAIAASQGAALLANASPAMLGVSSWNAMTSSSANNASTEELISAAHALRKQPVSKWLSFSAPGFLLRLPYGANSDPLDSLAFEELAQPEQQPEDLLWGASSVLCARLLAESFASRGWRFQPGDRREIDDCPAYTYPVEGETHLQASAEVLLNEQLAEALLAGGVVPLVSFKNRNAIVVPRFQAFADPLVGLHGPWQ